MGRGRQTAMLVTGMCLLIAVAFTGARGEESWRADFDTTCGRTTEAMTLSVEELTRLLERCDRLRTAIAGEDETVRKVFLKRLEMCRNLYLFVLETKQKERKEEPSK